ncbi:hypothetical protein PG990_001207 [Apiospora arundinis]
MEFFGPSYCTCNPPATIKLPIVIIALFIFEVPVQKAFWLSPVKLSLIVSVQKKKKKKKKKFIPYVDQAIWPDYF